MTAWTVVVPVKRRQDAKSRLAASGDGAGELASAREGLAVAFALDTLAAVRAASSVARLVLVTSEPRVGDAVREHHDVTVLPDPGGGLNAALRAGVRVSGSPAAILLGDLPALRPTELDAALAAARDVRLGVVTDADGTGTTLLTSLDARGLEPRFGPGSAAAHRAAGHVVLDDAAGPGLRRDVDRPADLGIASALGLGARTRDVVG